MCFLQTFNLLIHLLIVTGHSSSTSEQVKSEKATFNHCPSRRRRHDHGPRHRCPHPYYQHHSSQPPKCWIISRRMPSIPLFHPLPLWRSDIDREPVSTSNANPGDATESVGYCRAANGPSKWLSLGAIRGPPLMRTCSFNNGTCTNQSGFNA